ncbi:MAG TPA: lipoyl(octanoyl) transferase LipB [Tepidisphaeraceae bacterium]|nr:lipoyl(octanoyl) transferase LipB [Tepidisphaeraceae bacterium]
MLRVQDLGMIPYRAAWALQEQIHSEVAAGGDGRLLLLEHPPVITIGRRPEGAKNLLASEESLSRLGVELVHSDRGGDITFHGPGQLVAYPIIRLNDHALSVGGYVRLLQETVIAALAEFGVKTHRDSDAIGVWTEDGAKICAIGVRIRRGISMHGLALNVSTDLSFFNLIVPCGLAGRPVTSLRKILGDSVPTMDRVKEQLAVALERELSAKLVRG